LDIKAQFARFVSLLTETNRFDWIVDGVALGTDNVSASTLQRNRINAVVSVGAKLKNNGLKLEKIYLEVKDGEPPSEEQAFEAVKWIDERVSKGGKVFIHCHAGMGRSVTLLICYLLQKGYRLEDAVSLVRRRHAQSSPTSKQLAFIKQFSQAIPSRLEAGSPKPQGSSGPVH
jgi:protein-tyrosine phosphatase